MTIGNILRKTTLFSLTVLAVYNADGAWAYNPRTQSDAKPSIEINLDVIDKLAGNPASGAVSGKEPFGEPTSATNPLKKSGKSAKHHKRAHKKKVTKPKPEPEKTELIPETKAVNQLQDEPSPMMETPAEQRPPVRPKPPIREIQPLPQAPSDLPPLPPVTPATKASPPAMPPEQPMQMPPLPQSGGNAPPALPPLPGSANAPAVAPLPPASAPELAPLPAPSAPAAGIATPAPAPVKELAPPPLPPVPAPPLAAPPTLPPSPPVSAPAPAPSAAVPPAAPDLVAMPPLPASPSTAKSVPAGNAAAPDLQIVFGTNETDVPLNQTGKLDEIAMKLIKNPDLRASIIAYASGADAISIYPKRVSLARGIAVRDYLTTARNIDVERVTVKALGNKSEAGPADRVDLFLIK